MKKRRVPEIHFYEWRVAQWLTSMTRLTADLATRGAYRDLLDTCYKDGWIPSDIPSLAALCLCPVDQMAQIWPRISRHFEKDKNDSSRLRNRFADLYRHDYFSYLKRQSRNRGGKTEKGRSGNSSESSEKQNGGATTVRKGPDDRKDGSEPNTKRYDTKRDDTKRDDGRRDETPPSRDENSEPLIAADFSAAEPYTWFCDNFRGEIPENTYQAFGVVVNTPERLKALQENLIPWMETPKYQSGHCKDAVKFLRDGAWLRKPPEYGKHPAKDPFEAL